MYKQHDNSVDDGNSDKEKITHKRIEFEIIKGHQNTNEENQQQQRLKKNRPVIPRNGREFLKIRNRFLGISLPVDTFHVHFIIIYICLGFLARLPIESFGFVLVE